MAHHTHRRRCMLAVAVLLANFGTAQAIEVGDDGMPTPARVVWVDNESFGFASCPAADEQPDSADPHELMRALRERGLADARQMLRTRALVVSTVTLTPVSADARCDGTAASMVFRLSAVDRATGQAWTSNLVSTLPTRPNRAGSVALKQAAAGVAPPRRRYAGGR